MDVLKGGAIFALIAGFWTNIKSGLSVFLSIFIQRDEIRSDQMHIELIGYLINNHKYFKNYHKVYNSQFESFRNGKYGIVPYEKYGENMMIFLSERKHFLGLLRVPIILTRQTNAFAKGEKNQGDEKEKGKTKNVYITSIKGTFKLPEIISKVIEEKNIDSWNMKDISDKKNRFNIFYFPKRGEKDAENKPKPENYTWFKQNHINLMGVDENDLGREFKSMGDALDKLYFNDDIKELIELVRIWIKSENWYKVRNIPWKLGWLLYGKPGTGKTALTRAFAEALDIPIYSFSLAQLSNEDFINSWQSMQLNTPCIALIEDIDNVFDKRKNISAQYAFPNIQGMGGGSKEGNDGNTIFRPLTFDTLINSIDGVDKTDGVFTIITTNDITKIDEAIGIPNLKQVNGLTDYTSTRPGRIDKAIELGCMSNENKWKMAHKILDEFPNALDEVAFHIQKDKEETPAQFQSYCSQLALKEFWKSKHQEVAKMEVINSKKFV